MRRKSSLDVFIQYLIPPTLIILLVASIFEIFFNVTKYHTLITILDVFVITIFAVDLYFRWQERVSVGQFFKKHWIDVIATIPFNFIFIGVSQLVFVQGLRLLRPLARSARLLRYARVLRFARYVRFLRFLRMGKHIKTKTGKRIQQHEKELKGTLSFRVILLITVNSIMGTGIYFLTAVGAKHAGPASLLSWGILSLISLYIAMCFAELTSMFPKAGGVYEYAKQAYGRFFSFLVGWATAIAGSVTIAMLLLGALQYLIPLEYSYLFIPISLVLIVIFNAVAYRGMQTSTYMLVGFALVTLLTVGTLILRGSYSVNFDHFNPFFVFPSLNIVLAIFFIAETFFGWESATFLSAETKNPQKVMPKALIIGTAIIAILALALSFVGIGVIPWQTYGDSAAPLRDLGNVLFGDVGGFFFTIMVFVAIIGSVASWVVTAPRLLMSIAEDKLFFTQFARIHPKHKSPYVSILFQTILISILVVIGAGSYETLLHILVPLILLVYSAVLFSVALMRFTKPNIKRYFKVPFGKIGPFITILFMGFLLVMFIKETHGALDIIKISAALVAFGLPAYFLIELFYDAPYVRLRRIAWIKMLHYFHKLPYSKMVFRRVLQKIGKSTNKHIIVDFDTPLNYFTKLALKHHLPHKQLIALAKTKEEHQHLKKAVKGTKTVKTSRQKSLSFRTLGKVDKLVSFQSFGFAKNPQAFVKELSHSLKKKGKYCLYLRHHPFYMTPNAPLLDDDKKLKAMFKEQGLSLKVEKRGSIFTKEYFIYGEKK